MYHWDVTYQSPAGFTGIHYAVQAENEFDAAKTSPIILCYGTPWTPEEFKVLTVCSSKHLPQEQNND